MRARNPNSYLRARSYYPAMTIPRSAGFELLLIRHGVTDSNAGGVLQGHLPVPLNEDGRRQAQQLAQRLAQWRPAIRTLISSDLVRAAQTAEPIARSLKLEPIFDPAWRERMLGEYQGKSVGEKKMWDAATGHLTPPGAESVQDMRHRVTVALSALPEQFAKRSPVVVITHGGVIRTIWRLFKEGKLPLDQSGIDEIEIVGNCSIWHLHWTGQAWQINCANDMSHLSTMSDTDAG
jgi:broad specificity phosphatase PhoE